MPTRRLGWFNCAIPPALMMALTLACKVATMSSRSVGSTTCRIPMALRWIGMVPPKIRDETSSPGIISGPSSISCSRMVRWLWSAKDQEVVAMVAVPAGDEIRIGVAVRLGGVGVDVAFVPVGCGHFGKPLVLPFRHQEGGKSL